MSANLDDALAMLPHDPPMLLIEENLGLIPGERARARRRADAATGTFKGTFPGDPSFPRARSRCFWRKPAGSPHMAETRPKRSFRVAALGPFKFPAAAGVGAMLEAVAWVERRMGSLVRVAGIVTADGTTVADGSVTLAEVDEPKEVPT